MPKFLHYVICFNIFILSIIECQVLKELIYEMRTSRKNGTTLSCHITWTDQYDDSFSFAYTHENKTDPEFMFDTPKPELIVSKTFVIDSFKTFFDMFKNQTTIEKLQITVPSLTDSMKKMTKNKANRKNKPYVQNVQFNSYDPELYENFLKLFTGTPQSLGISFFSYLERTTKILDGAILTNPKVRNINEIDLRRIVSDVNDLQLQQLKSETVYIRATAVTSAGLNKILREWQDGHRSTKHLKAINDDFQIGDIMDGIIKKTIQRGEWEVKNWYNVTATVTMSRVPTNLFDAKPTFEFIVT